jgi:hypothetical protein
MEREYTFTGFMPSGNPFLWYYDEIKRTAFTTSIQVETWSKEPQKGDKIKIEKSGEYNDVTEKVYINNELVYSRSDEKERQQQEVSNRIHNELLESKGIKYRF